MREATLIETAQAVLLNDLLGHQLSVAERELWKATVPRVAGRIMRDLKLRTRPIVLDEMADGSLTIRATGVAGLLNICNTRINILPKFTQDTYAPSWPMSIMTMLSRTRRRHYTYSRVKGLSYAMASFIDHIALAYIDSLQVALRSEPIHVYRVREEATPYLRGRLAVGRQLVAMLNRPHLLECDVDYLETDNRFNRLLHWAGRRFVTLALDSGVARELVATLDRLPPVREPLSLPLHLPGRPPAQFGHYEEALDIARSLARGYGHGQAVGVWEGYGYLLNMERLFESFLERSLSHALALLDEEGYEVVAQFTSRYAEPAGHIGHGYFTTPDNVIFFKGSPILLIDAKYKRFLDSEIGTTSRPHNSDIYQLFASEVAQGCRRGLLVYPKLDDAGLSEREPKYWLVDVAGTKNMIGAVAVDLGNLVLPEFDQRLTHIIREALTLNIA